MKFEIEKGVFLRAIKNTLEITKGGEVVFILGHVLIETGKNKISITAMDGSSLSSIEDCEATINEAGSIVLPARMLFKMVNELPEGTLLFRKKGNNWVQLLCGKVVYNLPGLPANDFPVVKMETDIEFCNVKSENILEMQNKVSFAISSEETRPSLNGALLESKRKGKSHTVKMVATDGHRLSVVEKVFYFLELEKGILIPVKGLLEIKQFAGGVKEFEMGISDSFCILRTDTRNLRISFIDAEFPDYNRVIPKEVTASIEVNTGVFLLALNRMAVIVDEHYSASSLSFSKGQLEMTMTHPDLGDVRDTIKIEYDGEPFEKLFNTKYLIDAVGGISGDSFFIDCAELGMILREEDNSYFCVVMGVRV